MNRSDGSLIAGVARGTLLSFVGQSVTMIATLTATPWVIRLLGSQQYGVLALVNVLLGHLSFADLGMGTASTRFGAVAHAKGDDRGEATAIWSALVLAMVPAATAAIVLLFSAPALVVQGLRLPSSLQSSAIICVRLVGVAFLARAISGVLNTPALVRLRFDLVVPITSGTAAAQILLVPLVIFLDGGLVGAVIVVACAPVAAALLHAGVGLRLLPELRRPRVDRRLLLPLAHFGGALVVSTLADTLLIHAEKLLMPRYASVRGLAHYAVAFTLANMLTQLPLATLQSLIPALSRLHAAEDLAAVERMYRRALQGMIFWILPGGLFLSVVARPFFTMWAGPEFGIESTLPFYLLIGGIMLEILSYPAHALLVAYAKTGTIARCQVSLLVPYLFASVLLIQRFGAAGAAIAWTARALVGTTLLATLARRASGIAFISWPAKKVPSSAALLVLLTATAAAFLAASLIVRIALISAGVIAYGLIILTLVLTEEQRLAVRRVVRIS
jgi:O-antigen/teichoic acid export membrane protein